jgi:hypothetical protein
MWLLVGLLVLPGCTVGLPPGKPWTVDTSAWLDSQQCRAPDCALDAYESRDFTPDAAIPGVLSSGQQVQVHCFVPTPSPQRDPSGRDAYRWYLLTADSALVWAPDLALTAEPDLRRSPDASGDHLAAGLDLCHSSVPGR